MAQSRLERIGTVYSRIISLLKAKAIKEEDKPLWLAVYKAFPPKYEPRFDRELPSKPIRPIFYEEDSIRAKFQKDCSFIPTINLVKENEKSATQHFLSIYKNIQQEEEKSEEDAYIKAMQQYTSEMNAKMEKRKAKYATSDNYK